MCPAQYQYQYLEPFASPAGKEQHALVLIHVFSCSTLPRRLIVIGRPTSKEEYVGVERPYA